MVRSPRALLGLVGLSVVAIAVVWGIVGPPADPLEFRPQVRFLPPSLEHLMGTDQFGRDVFSRVLAGAPLSVGTGVGAMAVAATIGIPLGLIAGFWQGPADLMIGGATDLLLAFPAVLLALLVVATIGGGDVVNVALAVGVASIPVFVRVSRAAVLSTRRKPFIEAAETSGATSVGIVLHHVLPNIRGPIIVMATVVAGAAILVGSSLSFVGLGLPPPSPEWGAMLSDAREYLQLGWWLWLFPGLAVVVAVLSLNFIADFLGAAPDPVDRPR